MAPYKRNTELFSGNDRQCDHQRDYELKKQNAKLAISIARKMNALIFLVPEDIVDVRAKLILTFVGSLMSLSS
jgi:plastin-1